LTWTDKAYMAVIGCGEFGCYGYGKGLRILRRRAPCPACVPLVFAAPLTSMSSTLSSSARTFMRTTVFVVIAKASVRVAAERIRQ
jgi:hypothetical protein